LTGCQEIISKYNKFGHFVSYFDLVQDLSHQGQINKLKIKKMFRRRLLDEFDNLFNSLLNQDPFVYKGKTQKETGKDELGDWSKETFTSEDGMIQFTTIFRSTQGNTPQSEEPTNLERFKKELKKAVNLQEFEKAVELRDKIKNLEDNKVKLNDLNFELMKAVDQQDFEKAIELRDEIKKLS